MGDATTNHLSGIKDVPRAVTHIRRGLILPSKSLREFQRDISLISANKAFVMGGTFDTSTRTFVVDRVDAPNLELTVSDWVVYDNRRYEVKEFTEFEFDSAWVIVGRAIEGEIPEQIRLLCADNLIRLDHSSVQTK